SLGVLVLALALLAARRRRFGIAQVLGASLLVALAIPLYMKGQVVPALAVAGLGEALLLVAALRWSNLDLSGAAVLTVAGLVFQALVGKWSLALLVTPVIVMGHLLGGMLTFSLLAWLAWRATHRPIVLVDARALRRWVLAGIAVLGVQIARVD